MIDRNHHPWHIALVLVVEEGFSSTSSPHWRLRCHERASQLFILVSLGPLRYLFFHLLEHCFWLFTELQSPKPRQTGDGADLYSSGSPHNVTGRTERRSEWARICERMCVRDIYLRVYVRVQVCTSLYVCVLGGLPLLHTPTLPKLISLFMREASSKRRQMKT